MPFSAPAINDRKFITAFAFLTGPQAALRDCSKCRLAIPRAGGSYHQRRGLMTQPRRPP